MGPPALALRRLSQGGVVVLQFRRSESEKELRERIQLLPYLEKSGIPSPLSALFLSSPTFPGFVRANECLPLGSWKIQIIPVMRRSSVSCSTSGFSGETLPFTQVRIIFRRFLVPGVVLKANGSRTTFQVL